MPINLHVEGDPNGLHACAGALDGVAKGVHTSADDVSRGKSSSESVWRGEGGKGFRDRAGTMSAKMGKLGDAGTDAGKAAKALGDELNTVKSQMVVAADHAAGAGLTVTYGPKGPESIADPPPMSRDGDALASVLRSVTQHAAYNDAQQIANAARLVEKAAHETAIATLSGIRTVIEDQSKNWTWAFTAGGAASGYVSGVIEKYDKFTKEADDFKNLSDELGKSAQWAAQKGNPSYSQIIDDAMKQAQKGGADATKAADFTSKFLGGQQDSRVARAIAANAGDLAKDGSLLADAGKAIPGVGTAIALTQVGWDVKHAGSAGEAAKDAGRDMGGFVAGSVATDALMGSAVAGPAGVVAVGIGIGVAVGVSELIDHW